MPARSPRKTRPPRRPPRSARPLVRPTSFMRTTTPRSSPAKAPRRSRSNLRFSSRCDLRPSPALFAQPPRENNTDSPATTHSTPHARHPPSAHITMDAPRRTRMRARVALTCIYTAHTTHSRHRLPLAALFHSNARAPADTFLVPARSPRKTRPSRRPPRSARPLVRPTSFMRTTTPAKAPPMMNRLRCAQALFTNAKGRQQPAVLQQPRGCV